jgi:hypothetical protein
MLKGQPQTYQQLLDIKKLIMVIYSWTHWYFNKIYALSIGNGGDGSLNFNATMTPKKKSNNQTNENNLYSWSNGGMV